MKSALCLAAALHTLHHTCRRGSTHCRRIHLLLAATAAASLPPCGGATGLLLRHRLALAPLSARGASSCARLEARLLPSPSLRRLWLLSWRRSLPPAAAGAASRKLSGTSCAAFCAAVRCCAAAAGAVPFRCWSLGAAAAAAAAFGTFTRAAAAAASEPSCCQRAGDEGRLGTGEGLRGTGDRGACGCSEWLLRL